MNNKITSFMMFIFGAAVGSVVTWQYIKKKYEQIAQEEIDSVKETFSKLKVKNKDNESEENNNVRTIVEIVERAKDKPSIMEYAAKLHKQGYTNYSNTDSLSEDSNVSEEKVVYNGKPYVISPDEFGELDDYETISLTYYADQILADEDDELVEDIEETVGFESLNAFGEYEDDSVFVRNDRLKCDYEILLDQRKYSDVVLPIKRKPHEVED